MMTPICCVFFFKLAISCTEQSLLTHYIIRVELHMSTFLGSSFPASSVLRFPLRELRLAHHNEYVPSIQHVLGSQFPFVLEIHRKVSAVSIERISSLICFSLSLLSLGTTGVSFLLWCLEWFFRPTFNSCKISL